MFIKPDHYVQVLSNAFYWFLEISNLNLVYNTRCYLLPSIYSIYTISLRNCTLTLLMEGHSPLPDTHLWVKNNLHTKHNSVFQQWRKLRSSLGVIMSAYNAHYLPPEATISFCLSLFMYLKYV